MIENFKIDINLGRPDQVGLHLLADAKMADQFRRVLWDEKLNSLPYMPSNNPAEFRFFTYVSAPDSGLDKQGIYRKLLALCQAHRTNAAGEPVPIVDYDAWRATFDTYVQSYRTQRFLLPAQNPSDVFDKAHAYNLIQSARYDEAERYLRPFATDFPPALVPVYLIYLYHQWRRPADVASSYTYYESHLRASDVDHRVIEWIVEAHLGLSPPAPERALAVLDDFLPEFQRQGVAERLLILRSQVHALQGQLPQTVSGLLAYLAHASISTTTKHLEDLLEVIAGLSAPAAEIATLLNELTEHIEPNKRWRITLERSALARRNNNSAEALLHLQTVLDAPPPDLALVDLNALHLDAASLYLILGRPQDAIKALLPIPPESLLPAGQRAYWGFLGRAQLEVEQIGPALDALHRAYQLEARSPDVLQPLARLAYQAEDWDLARSVYNDLYQAGFEPGWQDRLYVGILDWLDGNLAQAVHHLENNLTELPLELVPLDILALASTALVESLPAVDASQDKIAAAVSNWTDVLAAAKDAQGLTNLADRIPALMLDRPTIFALLEAIEPLLVNHADIRRLAQHYAQLLCAEIDHSLRHEQMLPAYTLDVRRGLFELDRDQFNFVQDYLQDELKRAREAELVEAAFALEAAEAPKLDLSDKWVALVGGYEPVRRRMREILTREYNLGRFTEVPPSWEAHVDQAHVAEAVRGADLIVVVHRCIKHDGTDALKAVVEGTKLEICVRYAVGKGQSSMIKAVQGYFG